MQNIITGQVAVSPVTNRKSIVRKSIVRKSVARKLPHYLLSALLLAGFAGAAAPAFAAVPAPTNVDLTNGTDNGLFYNDNITSVQQPQFTGKGTPLSVVKLFAGNTQIGIGITNPSGQWFIASNVKLADGTYNFGAQQTLPGGTAHSASSTPLKVTIDTTVPVTSNADLVAGSDTGVSNTDDVTSVTQPILQGTGTPGAYITLFLMGSGKTVGNAIVGADGKWTATGQFAPGNEISYVILSKATDLAGNTKQAGGALNILVDTVAPPKAAAPDLIAASDSGVSNTDNKTNIMTPTFTVKCEPYGIVNLTQIAQGAKIIATVTANANGIATITPAKAFENGYYNMTAKVYDRAGNSADGASDALLVLTTLAPPKKASIPGLTADSESGIPGDSITNVTTPTVQGYNAEPNRTININFFAGIFQYDTTAKTDQYGHWTAKAPKTLPDGIYDVKATTIDDLGNSSESDHFKLTIDSTPPVAPPAPDLAFYNDYGVSNSDNITTSNESNNSYFEFFGKNTPRANYKLFNDGVLLQSGFVSANGEWLAKVKLNPGVFNLTFSVSDSAGNYSKPSPVLSGLVDGATPSCDLTSQSTGFAKDLTSLAGTAHDEVLNYSGIQKVTVKILKLNGGLFWNGTAWTTDNVAIPTDYASGKWSKTSGLPTAAQTPNGPYYILLYAYDNAGNGSLEKQYDVTVENGAPTVSFTTPSAGAVIKNLGTVGGTATDAISGIAKVELNLKRNSDGKFWDGSVWGTTAVALKTTLSGNNWSRLSGWPTAANFPNGNYTFTARAEDNAGNFATVNRSITASSTANATSSVIASSLHETQLLTASGSVVQNSLTLIFDGPLDPQTTEEVAGYIVKIGNYEAFISDVQLKGSNTVVLTFVEDVIQAGDIVNVSYDLLDAQGEDVIGVTSIAIAGNSDNSVHISTMSPSARAS